VNPVAVLGLALALALDAFAVAIGVGASFPRIHQARVLRMAFFFGLFQFGMPLAGWAAGRSLLALIQAFDHWVAAGLLFLVAGRMARQALRPESAEASDPADPTKGWTLLVLAVATSIDALAVGLSFGILEIPILGPALIFGIVAFGMSLAGTRIGPLLGRLAGRRSELVGALVLLAIGTKILMDHL
jgi:putative Mn2+ efflux pump MntP